MISTVHDAGNYYVVTDSLGGVATVPKDTANRDYARVQAWIAGGGTLS
jgi:hypothetical protein